MHPHDYQITSIVSLPDVSKLLPFGLHATSTRHPWHINLIHRVHVPAILRPQHSIRSRGPCRSRHPLPSGSVHPGAVGVQAGPTASRPQQEPLPYPTRPYPPRRAPVIMTLYGAVPLPSLPRGAGIQVSAGRGGLRSGQPASPAANEGGPARAQLRPRCFPAEREIRFRLDPLRRHRPPRP